MQKVEAVWLAPNRRAGCYAPSPNFNLDLKRWPCHDKHMNFEQFSYSNYSPRCSATGALLFRST